MRARYRQAEAESTRFTPLTEVPVVTDQVGDMRCHPVVVGLEAFLPGRIDRTLVATAVRAWSKLSSRICAFGRAGASE